MKVIFLDVDGVLNCASRWKIIPEAVNAPHEGCRIDPQAVAVLKAIIDETDANIVVSSTWRLSLFDVLTETLIKHGIDRERIIGRTDEIIFAPRRVEIQAFLDAHPDITAFLILDDDEDASIAHHFLRMTWQQGLEAQHLDCAIQILNRKVAQHVA